MNNAIDAAVEVVNISYLESLNVNISRFYTESVAKNVKYTVILKIFAKK